LPCPKEGSINCFESYRRNAIVQDTNSVFKEAEKQYNVAVFPNPASTYLQFQIDFDNDINIEIISMSGQLVREEVMFSPNMN
jgi:hypothetical protein